MTSPIDHVLKPRPRSEALAVLFTGGALYFAVLMILLFTFGWLALWLGVFAGGGVVMMAVGGDALEDLASRDRDDVV